jgi:hypothetical protein
MALTMEEWVMNDMYEGLLKMPLWVLCAFGSLEDGDRFRPGDVRLQLISWLVVQSMDKCPPQVYDNDYRHNWKVAPYIPLVKQAVKKSVDLQIELALKGAHIRVNTRAITP